MGLPVGNIYLYSYCRERSLVCPGQNWPWMEHISPQNHPEREPQRDCLRIQVSQFTPAAHIYDQRHMELSKEARLWISIDLAQPHAAYGCSGFQLFTFSMKINISMMCPKLSQDDTGKWVGILPHLDNTHCKLSSNSQDHAQLGQRPCKVAQEKFPFLLLIIIFEF